MAASASALYRWYSASIESMYSRIQTFQQLDLACVVEVMRGNAGDERLRSRPAGPGQRPLQRPYIERRHDAPQRAVHFAEHRDVSLPGIEARVLRTRKPVRADLGEGSALRTGQSTPRHVLPVRSVHDDLPDVVTTRSGPPRRLSGSDASERPAQVRPVPRDVVVRGIDQEQQLIDLAAHQLT